ncbi:transposase [Bradyrhizobium sp. 184]|uniref:transposase n=1 Tax=Bradyrhizobium sp. 184 TaxID=2782653 RepID=UPI001FFEDF3E|nr:MULTISPECIES: transposase [unclassified Bradyrhizobium]
MLKECAEARAQRLTADIETWVDRESSRCEFKDERLGRRFCKLLASKHPVCQD